MSFRDLRNFTEMMRALGFTRLISMENFRNPNFPLVAEILLWLVKRYDPNADLPSDIDTEQDRVIFIRSVAQFMATKAHIKLNTKKLYQADGYTVKELLKVTTIMYNAMKSNTITDDDSNLESNPITFNMDLSSKLADIKLTRMLASEITSKGAVLYDLLGREVELREARVAVLSKQFEINDVEAGLRASLKAVDEEIKKTNSMIENIASDEANLEAKIEKKKIELERSQKRLLTLKKVRPAFMDEYEKLEFDLAKQYQNYMIRFRCLTYLEQLLDEHERAEQEKIEQRHTSMQKMIEQMRQEELMNSDVAADLENGLASEDVEDLDETKDNDAAKGRTKRPQNGAGNRPVPSGREDVAAAARRIFGSMTGGDEDESGESLGSDTDLDLEGDGDADDVSDFGSDEEIQISSTVAARKTIARQTEMPDSDNDF